jgi:hypothetical protein
MITENEVISAVCRHLEGMGYEIEEARSTYEHDPDIIARHPKTNEVFLVEAKGATSSKEDSNRFGKPFNSSQVFTHVAKAFFTAMKLLCTKEKAALHVAVALPETPLHRRQVESAGNAFTKLGIVVWFVSPDGKVEK